MHELGIVLELFDLIEEIMNEQELKKVSTVTVEIGELCGVIPDYFKECWDVAKLNGTFNDTELIVEYIPAMAKCVCSNEFEMMKNSRICPICHKNEYEIISGKQFQLKQIEAY